MYLKWFELLMVIATGCLKFILMDRLNMRVFYITGICLFWAGYIWYRYSKDHGILNHWGYRKKNFKESMFILLPFVLISIITIIIFSTIKDTFTISWHILPILILYPTWGVIQQFMMVNLIAGNLQDLSSARLNKIRSMLITALIFSLVHHPYILLMIFTFVMEILFLLVFMKWRNLWALGLAHGWIATFLLFYSLERDLWTELFVWF